MTTSESLLEPQMLQESEANALIVFLEVLVSETTQKRKHGRWNHEVKAFAFKKLTESSNCKETANDFDILYGYV